MQVKCVYYLSKIVSFSFSTTAAQVDGKFSIQLLKTSDIFPEKNIWKTIFLHLCFWMLWNDFVIETNENISVLILLSSQEIRNLTLYYTLLLLPIIIFYLLGFVRGVFNCIIMLQTKTLSAYKCMTLSCNASLIPLIADNKRLWRLSSHVPGARNGRHLSYSIRRKARMVSFFFRIFFKQ